MYYTRELGPSSADIAGWLAIPAGLLLLGLGATTLWRTRRTGGSLLRRSVRRASIAAGAAIVAVVVVYPMAYAYLTVHVQSAPVPADRLGVAHEQVSFRTSDGLTLHGWYVPSRNGAAVIAAPGRKGPQPHVRLLARHGYGVLLFDRRGEGRSDGEPNAFGWGGDRDIKAAIAYLQHRPDVDPERIGGLGLSVGGELMLETAAETTALKAVVSEGAGARSFAEELDRERDLSGVERAVFVLSAAVKQASISVFANESPPSHLKDLVGRISPRPLLLIAAPNTRNGEQLNRDYHAAAAEPKALWEIPESEHTRGLDARPREYERRVVGFFDGALLGR